MTSTEQDRTEKRQFEEIVEDGIMKKSKIQQEEKGFMMEETQKKICWHRVYWLDEFTTSPVVDYAINRLKLRGMIDYLQTYTAIHQLLDDLQRFETKNEQVIIILTLSDTFDLFYQLHELSQIHSIYIYALSSKTNTIVDLSNVHPKVRGIYHDASFLISKVSHYIRQLEPSPLILQNTELNESRRRKEFTTAPYLMNARRPSEDWFNTLLNILEENQPGSNGKEIFLKHCRQLFANEPNVLQTVKEFESNYTAEQAIQWYTREGFAYRLLNQALRQRDQNLIILLHFFIFDLEHQLLKKIPEDSQSEHMKSEVYRGQLMSMEEINLLTQKTNRSMFFCSFLSTTTDFEVAMMFSGAGLYAQDSLIQPVIFHINYDTFQSARGAANIQHISFSQDEGEILFSPLHVLSPSDVSYNGDIGAYIMKCTINGNKYDLFVDLDQRLIEFDILLRILIDSDVNSNLNNDEECVQFTQDVILLRQELIFPKVSNATLDRIDCEETSSHIFQLHTLRSFDSDSLYHRPFIRADISAALYDCLGTLYKCKGQFECALKYYEKATKFGDKNIRKMFTRKVNEAQTHKMMGNFSIAWRMHEELLDEADGYHHEPLHKCITFDTPFLGDDYMPDDWFRKIYDYLEYIRKNIPLNLNQLNDSDEDSDNELMKPEDGISEDYSLLGRYFWYKTRDSHYALLCYQQELELTKIRMKDNLHASDLVDLGEIYFRIADVYSEIDHDKSVEYYHQAMDIFSTDKESCSVQLAVCWCALAQFRNENYLECFQRAFDLLVKRTSEDIYDLMTDSISECYFYLAKKYFNISSLNQEKRQVVLKWSEQALRFCLMDDYDQSDRQIDNYVQLLLVILSDDNTTVTYSKKELIEKWSPNEKHCPLLDKKQIQQILQETIETLSSASFSSL